MQAPRTRLGFLLAGFGLSLVSAQSPCDLQVIPGDPMPGADYDVHATARWDPDGAGPAGEVLVIGGFYSRIGAVRTNGLATWEPTTGVWSELGSGVSPFGINYGVRCIAAMPNGELIVGGTFTSIDGVSASNLARFDGFSWSSMGVVDGSVYALTAMPNGDLVIGGDFTVAGGIAAIGIARFDGVAWSSLGDVPNVRALRVRPNGDLVAGGTFSVAGGVAAANIARFDGTSWTALGAGCDGAVLALATASNGDLFAGGRFLTAGGLAASRIARWDGATWAPLGGGVFTSGQNGVDCLTTLSNGDLIAGGTFQGAGTVGGASPYMARWDGSSWLPIADGPSGQVRSLVTFGADQVLTGGSFQSTFGGVPCLRLAHWDGTAWQVVGTGFDSTINAMTRLTNGDLVVGGYFRSVDGASRRALARWDGSAWSGYPNSISTPVVFALQDLPNGDFAIGGYSGVELWNGSSFTGLGVPFDQPVTSLARLPNGDLIAAGNFTSNNGTPLNRIARWDGSGWQPLGSGLDAPATALAVMPNGDLIAVGAFQNSGATSLARVARWDGVTWSPLGTGLNQGASGALVRGDGTLVVVGPFTSAGGVTVAGVALWNGASWSAPGSGLTGFAERVVELPDSELVVSGSLGVNGAPAQYQLVRWDGTTWSSFESVVGIYAMAIDAGGDLCIAGNMYAVDGIDSPWWARLHPPCPASVATISTSPCPSSGGSNTYAADNLPWLGSTFQATATGLPQFAFLAVVTGFSALPAPFPLSIAFPTAPAGCLLYPSVDVFELTVSPGSLVTTLSLPNSPALAGAQVFRQVVALEVDATLQFVEVTATNALQLTLGTY